MKILEVKNLSKNYGKGTTLVKALDDVSFSVEEGEFVTIVGSSGSGKSTLLHILGAVDKPTSGEVITGGTSVFNTISTSMALIKREFVVLRSIGLTRNGFNKILFFESLFFGLKSLLYALPVSFGVILLIHKALSGMMSVSAIMIPWKSVIIAIVMVFVIVLLTMMYSSSKIKKHNIIDQIREENI